MGRSAEALAPAREVSMAPANRFPKLLLLVLAPLLLFTVRSAADDDRPRRHRLVAVPEEDRFTPFALLIHAGDTVEWVNNDTDDHTVVSDDAVNSVGPHNINVVLPGTDSNGGEPAPPFKITFQRAGQWIYYCRFHSHLDEFHQPNAPGPDGGIQGEKDPTSCDPAGKDTCNFGTPMMGVITILPAHFGEDASASPQQ
jgi:plastocyanin